MSAFPAVIFFILSCCFQSLASADYNCRWRTVSEAKSQIVNACLRLSVHSCDCTGHGCPGKFYKVEVVNGDCPAIITWCSWGPWTISIQTNQESTGCEKHGVRKRACCIKNGQTVKPTQSLDSKYWTCPTSSLGDREEVKSEVTCPVPSNSISVVFISLIATLFFITLVLVVVRIFFYKRLVTYFRNNVRGVVGPNQSHQPGDAYAEQAQAQLPPAYVESPVTGPPTYSEAMSQMPKLPTYDEVIGSSNDNLEAPRSIQPESVTPRTEANNESNETRNDGHTST